MSEKMQKMNSQISINPLQSVVKGGKIIIA